MPEQELKVIVIEDNEQMAEMIADHLKRKFTEADVTVYNTGENALNSAGLNPDVIILDYNLDTSDPKALNGLQIFMKIKKKFNAPVIFLTAQEKPEVSANMIKYGAYDYVVKNQDAFNKLETIITNLLITRRKPAKYPMKNFVRVALLLLAALLAVYLFNKLRQ